MKNFFVKKIKIFFLIFCALLILPLHLQAIDYTGLNFMISNPIISEGGVASSSAANFIEKGSIGGTRAIGKSTSTNYVIRSGFRYYDETAPEIDSVVVKDGLVEDLDEQTSLSSLSANWSGFSDLESGLRLIDAYEYAIYRDSDNKYWNSNNLSWQNEETWAQTILTSVSVSPVYLNTEETYFFKVRAHNNARMVSEFVSSDGIYVIPALSFYLDNSEISLGNLDATNNFTSENASTTLITSTNGYFGYNITVWSADVLRHINYSSETVSDFNGTNQNPMEWSEDCDSDINYCGFGYTTNDDNLSDGDRDRFVSGGVKKYASFNHVASNEIIADHTEKINGQTGEVIEEEFNIGYKISVDEEQVAGDYQTTIVFIVTPNF
ncbi:MAG: hypothetical protein U9P90_00620 [Patescibacteria group bacterium]|nr:hypothetical protein [Patescibacteria group bacterium]